MYMYILCKNLPTNGKIIFAFHFSVFVVHTTEYRYLIQYCVWVYACIYFTYVLVYFRDAGSISSLDEFLDSIHTTLEELWRLPNNYPQNRMVDLIDIICKFYGHNNILHNNTPANNVIGITKNLIY